MKRIRYYYSAMSKQVFLIILFLFILARMTIFFQVVFYNINDYAKLYNVKASIFLYAIYIVLCLFFFYAYKGFYVEYDEHKVIYYNRIIQKRYFVDLDMVSNAVLNKNGIYLYYSSDDITKNSFTMFIPFSRFGVISPVGVDDFYKLLKQKNIVIEKSFVELPVFGKSKNWISMLYSGLALFALASLTQALALINAIAKSH